MTVREASYDEVADAARDFRTLLSAMSRPATIYDFGPVAIDPPAGVAPASACVALALLSSETGFSMIGMPEQAAEYIRANTRSEIASFESADFLFFGSADSGEHQLAAANRGDLSYPDRGATIVVQLADLSSEPLPDSIRVDARGPGVDGSAVFYGRGLHPVWLGTLRAANAEYPLGVDVIFTCGTRIACLPRSTSFNWG